MIVLSFLQLPCKVLQVKYTQTELVTFSREFTDTKCKLQNDGIPELEEVFAVRQHNLSVGWTDGELKLRFFMRLVRASAA